MMAWIALLLASLFSMLAQLCQKQSTRLMPSGDRRRHLLLWQGLALLMLGAGMALWLRVLQHIPVGIAYPMLSLNFIWITLAARFIWREPVTLRHWGGVVMIIAGVALLGGCR